MSQERSQRAFRSIVGKAIPEVILDARWANIVLGAKSVARTLSEALSLDSWDGHPEVIPEARWGNIALGAKSLTRTLSEALPLDSWEGHPRSDNGRRMGKYCSGSKK